MLCSVAYIQTSGFAVLVTEFPCIPTALRVVFFFLWEEWFWLSGLCWLFMLYYNHAGDRKCVASIDTRHNTPPLSDGWYGLVVAS